jgi:hypothetical protein
MLIIITKFSFFAQNKDYLSLSKRIDSMSVEDQKYRKLLSKIYLGQTDTTEKQFIKAMLKKTDSLNEIEVKNIFYTYGYPKISMVGKNSSNKFWLLVQHCDKDVSFQEQIMKAMKKLINENECSKNEYAYLTDRVMINKGKAQIYGTQVEVNKEGTEYVPKKLYKPKHVDKRRKKMEIIPNSLQDYLDNMKRDFLKK